MTIFFFHMKHISGYTRSRSHCEAEMKTAKWSIGQFQANKCLHCGFLYSLNLVGDLIDVDAAVVCLLLVVTIPALWVEIISKFNRWKRIITARLLQVLSWHFAHFQPVPQEVVLIPCTEHTLYSLSKHFNIFQMSMWSTLATPMVSSEPLFYGADVASTAYDSEFKGEN